MQRFDFIPYRQGKMVDIGGYYDGTLRDAIQQAYTLAIYHYDSVSIEHAGVIVDVVRFKI